MRSFGLSAFSLILTAAVIGNAYYQKKQFYPSVVYITKSSPSMAVIYLQFFVIVYLIGKLLKKIFFGTLRPAEFEHLMERFWYALTETCLAFTVFRDDFNPRFVALFTILLVLKSFHWLAEERVDYMERSPVIGWLFHVRVTSLLTLLGVLDHLMILHAYNQTISKGPSVQLVFGFEYAILITMVANTTIKYVLHAAEMRADTPWENKAVFLLYTELIIGLIKVILYVLFVVIMAKIYALPMFVFRPMFYTMRNFKKALNDVIMSRRAIRNMNTLYPDATPEELAMSDNICIICREDMVSNSKKLPCGHIFHTACLRSWFQRQQTCPTCRLNILRTPTNSQSLPRAADAANAAGNLNQNNPGNQTPLPGFNLNNNNNNNNNNNVSLENPFANLYNHNIGMGGAANVAGGIPMAPTAPFVFPPFPFVTPYAVPPPPMPPALDTLTDEEIRALEGNERRHVEERIKLLRNIQLLLDASVSLMNQYSAITARLPPIPTATQTPQMQAQQQQQHEQQTSSDQPQPSTSAQADIISPQLSSSSTASSSLSPPPLKKIEEKLQSNITPVAAAVTTAIKATVNTGSLTVTAKQETTEVKIEDLGSEEHIDDLHNAIKCSDGSSRKDEITENYDNSEVCKIRRRRLQKFLQNERKEN